MGSKRKKNKSPPPAPKKPDFKNRPLSELSRLIPQETEKKGSAAGRPPAPPKQKTPPPPPDDEQLFAQAMADTRPLGQRTQRREPPEKARDFPMPRPYHEREEEEVMHALQELVDGDITFAIEETDEYIEGMVEGLDPAILRKLRRGEYSIQDDLDLHGSTREEARAKVAAFLLRAIADGKRCVLVVHGRGLGSKDRVPVLKNSLAQWFTHGSLRKKVLAFATAQPCDGGAGAVYVLLRKSRGNP
jgi:DNA-nicking Smr family endonuclease